MLSITLFPVFAKEQAEFPGRRVGGGTRGECDDTEAGAFVALNPASHLGVTHQERPTLYFAVSESAETYEVRLALLNSVEPDLGHNMLYETTLEVGDERELIGIQLPENLLLEGQYYLWQFVVICEPDDPSRNIVLEGWIAKEATDTTTAIADFSPVEGLAQAQRYQTAGLWLDAIALSIELLESDPHLEAVQTQWSQLLQALELDAVLDDPLAVRPLGDLN
ncbi:MAG: DUF928 domain-containing protein [Leptolyngbya sp. RL_3_1]|nr:DUF928 domain-containing protein [Leptolyngbya sp. RL_3_1]